MKNESTLRGEGKSSLLLQGGFSLLGDFYFSFYCFKYKNNPASIIYSYF